ncbi:glycoside hydrolase family 15 protein [Singulisphaera sp. PoT]|uniref:glycoside hydrolase family 15 protein n=1 Tax=Singulisphaera sp. PoT TaxID=3411797 RepID=UPI003BF61357
MVSTWIEAAAKGRHGGPVRAGVWSAVVVGTHPIEADQIVWLEVSADDVPLGPLPAFWIENKGVNSLWHVPIPPQPVGVRLHYRSAVRCRNSEVASSPPQDTIVRPNLPDRSETSEIVGISPEGLVGNRQMTARVDSRGSTYDIYFPTVGLHSDVRPAEGDRPQSRSHFRAIVGGLAVGRRLDWFTERLSWEPFQHYLGATNLLMTELSWRGGPIRVLITDFIAMGSSLPRTAGGTESPGQYIKRFRIKNEGSEARRALLGVYIHAEVNGGIGEPGLSWQDGDRTLLATNRGHAHANRKLARDATVEFAVALDDRGEVHCEPTGPNEAILLRWLDLSAGETVTVDLLVSGAFTGWRGDPGTFEHWLRPALAWFRSADLDQVEQSTGQEWDSFVEPLPSLHFAKPTYAVSLRRSALATAVHADAQWGAIASGFDRGLSAYCWPRDAIWVAGTMDRLGHTSSGRGVFQWLSRVRGLNRPYSYWFQKYTIDGGPEWETPAVDQTAMIPWGIERHYRRTADREFVASVWPMIEQAALVCSGESGHPGLRWVDELKLISSAGLWDQHYGAFLYSNACVVAGLRAAARLAELLEHTGPAARWRELADEIWNVGILGTGTAPGSDGPGLVDIETGRFLDARRLSTVRSLWTDRPEMLLNRSRALDISQLGLVVPFGLLPASDPRLIRTAEAILRHNAVSGDPNMLSRWSTDPKSPDQSVAPSESHSHDISSLATLWMARYLLDLGRETGQVRHWNRAVAMLDGILARLLPLGLLLRSSLRVSDGPKHSGGAAAGVWGLHAMLADTMLEFAGLDYDAVDRRLMLKPALPSSWPHIGLSQTFACGEVTYRLERPIGGAVHHLSINARLQEPVMLEVVLSCPGLTELGPWQSVPEIPAPPYDRRSCRLAWNVELPAGESSWTWQWG